MSLEPNQFLSSSYDTPEMAGVDQLWPVAAEFLPGQPDKLVNVCLAAMALNWGPTELRNHLILWEVGREADTVEA